jgi:exonuclease III
MTDRQQYNNNQDEAGKLRIQQQNLNKSLVATEHLLNSTAPELFDIIAIQEPYIDFKGKARARWHWYPIYPKSHYTDDAGYTRSMLLINRKIASDTWTAIDIDSPDVTGVQIKTANSIVIIFNLYCDQKHSDAIRKTNNIIQAYRRANRDAERRTEIIWVGDFN